AAPRIPSSISRSSRIDMIPSLWRSPPWTYIFGLARGLTGGGHTGATASDADAGVEAPMAAWPWEGGGATSASASGCCGWADGPSPAAAWVAPAGYGGPRRRMSGLQSEAEVRHGAARCMQSSVTGAT